MQKWVVMVVGLGFALIQSGAWAGLLEVNPTGLRNLSFASQHEGSMDRQQTPALVAELQKPQLAGVSTSSGKGGGLDRVHRQNEFLTNMVLAPEKKLYKIYEGGVVPDFTSKDAQRVWIRFERIDRATGDVTGVFFRGREIRFKGQIVNGQLRVGLLDGPAPSTTGRFYDDGIRTRFSVWPNDDGTRVSGVLSKGPGGYIWFDMK